VGDLPRVGDAVVGRLDWPRRYALMRHHTLLHIVNAVVLARYGGMITGAQIGEAASRIDFNLTGFTREQIPVLELEVNGVISAGAEVAARTIARGEYDRRPELRRTLTVMPPVLDGAVRIVEIGAFDAQACGGTHVHDLRELGVARVTRFDNKGRNNKRFYWALSATMA
jgi:misacylated tRNA(Ala) deacylase